MGKAIPSDVDEYAREMSANFDRFDSFIFWGRSEYQPAENWCLVYVDRGNQSTLIDESNAATIADRLGALQDTESADGLTDAVPISCSHWAGGKLSGYMLRIWDDAGNITPKFAEWHRIQRKLDDYPILNESDYSERESEATERNIAEAVRQYANTLYRDDGIDSDEFPDGWESQVAEWIRVNEWPENSDGQGGWPDDDTLTRAFAECGLIELVDAE